MRRSVALSGIAKGDPPPIIGKSAPSVLSSAAAKIAAQNENDSASSEML